MDGPDAQDALAHTRDALRRARRVCVLTGAGMSAESGIPTFRDAMVSAATAAQGGADASPLWSRFDPAALASEAGFRADPAAVWDWYAERRDGVRRAEPNAGHRALADFAARRPGVLTVVTQNVDDLHQRAGNADTIRLHGDLLSDRWLGPCRRQPACAPSDARPGRPPRCADCDNLARPAVVWFGEMLPAAALRAAERAAAGCELMLVVGTSGAVWPAAGLAGQARAAGARVVIVNPAPSEIDDAADVVLRGTAAGLLPALLGR
jgi:NAD-dependent deacetylase